MTANRPIFRRTATTLTETERKHRTLQQRIALASVPNTHPLWVTILQIVDEHERNMVARVMEERLSNEERHYNAGLAAGAEYLANALRDMKAQAELDARKQKHVGADE